MWKHVWNVWNEFFLYTSMSWKYIQHNQRDVDVWREQFVHGCHDVPSSERSVETTMELCFQRVDSFTYSWKLHPPSGGDEVYKTILIRKISWRSNILEIMFLFVLFLFVITICLLQKATPLCNFQIRVCPTHVNRTKSASPHWPTIPSRVSVRSGTTELGVTCSSTIVHRIHVRIKRYARASLACSTVCVDPDITETCVNPSTNHVSYYYLYTVI